jgi:hypothetical protein
MRFLLVLAVPLLVLLAFAVACGDGEKEAQVTPTPAGESDGDAADWDAGDGVEDGEDGAEPPPLRVDSDGDDFIDSDEERLGSDPFDPASVPESGPGGCTDGVDNDLDGLIDGADPDCPEEGPDLVEDSDGDGVPDIDDDDDENDGFSDGDENVYGSDHLDDASVPENEDANPGSCADGVDNDLDGDTDDADDGCPLAGFRPVASANLGATPRDYVGPCPKRFTFAGFITLEAGSGPVSYEFVRSDGIVSPRDPLIFDSPGTQDVSYEWTLRGDSFSGWVVIRILEPAEVESNRANFTLRCG